MKKRRFELHQNGLMPEWIDALNTFAQSQTEAWKLNVTSAQHQMMDSKTISEHHGTEVDSSIWSTTGGYQSIQQGSYTFGSLCQYGMGWMPQPGREKNPTVVYDSWITNGMPSRFYGKDELDVAYTRMLRDFFDYSELDVIVTGHQPGELKSGSFFFIYSFGELTL